VGETYAEEIKWMKQWIQRRIVWIDSQFLPAPSMTPKRSGGPGAKLGMRGERQIYFTTDLRSHLPGGWVSPARLYARFVLVRTLGFARTHRMKNEQSVQSGSRQPSETDQYREIIPPCAVRVRVALC
jgi:hypothetical protein